MNLNRSDNFDYAQRYYGSMRHEMEWYLLNTHMKSREWPRGILHLLQYPR